MKINVYPFVLLYLTQATISFSQIDTTILSDPFFEFVYVSKPIKIPELSLDKFRKNHHIDFYNGIDSIITDKNFDQTQIRQGDNKKIKIYRISKQNQSSTNCVNFIRTQKGILPGPQGLALAWLFIRDNLPKNSALIIGFSNESEEQGIVTTIRYTVGKAISFNEKGEKILFDYGRGWFFDFGDWRGNWQVGTYLLFFSD